MDYRLYFYFAIHSSKVFAVVWKDFEIASWGKSSTERLALFNMLYRGDSQ